MTTTYGGKATTDEAVKSGEEVVVGDTTTDFSAEESKEHQEYIEYFDCAIVDTSPLLADLVTLRN